MFTLSCVCFAVLCGWASAESTFFDTCKLIGALECDTFEPHQKCGTNGMTYPNRCEFAKAHCGDPDIHYFHPGSCGTTPSPGATTQQPHITTTHDTHEVIQDVFCRAMMEVSCLPDQHVLCGSNGFNYENYCFFEKARCLNKNLTIAHVGNCMGQ